MATNYDAPPVAAVDDDEVHSLEELKGQRAAAQSRVIDVDETELNEALELPGADLSGLSGDELTVRVLPKRREIIPARPVSGFTTAPAWPASVSSAGQYAATACSGWCPSGRWNCRLAAARANAVGCC
jgi:Domain of unknown function (DUF4193)